MGEAKRRGKKEERKAEASGRPERTKIKTHKFILPMPPNPKVRKAFLSNLRRRGKSQKEIDKAELNLTVKKSEIHVGRELKIGKTLYQLDSNGSLRRVKN